MSDVVWESKNKNIKILVDPEQSGFMVKKSGKDSSIEKWNTWNAFFDRTVYDELERVNDENKALKEIIKETTNEGEE